MVATVAAVLILLLGLLLMLVAFLSAHRTVVPMMSRPGLLWWPAVGLLALSLVMFNLPYFIQHTRCENACDIIDDASANPTEPYSQIVQEEYDNCVVSGVAEAKRKAFEARKAGEDRDPEAEGKAAEPGMREVCHHMVVSRCITSCYKPDEGL